MTKIRGLRSPPRVRFMESFIFPGAAIPLPQGQADKVNVTLTFRSAFPQEWRCRRRSSLLKPLTFGEMYIWPASEVLFRFSDDSPRAAPEHEQWTETCPGHWRHFGLLLKHETFFLLLCVHANCLS